MGEEGGDGGGGGGFADASFAADKDEFEVFGEDGVEEGIERHDVCREFTYEMEMLW
jgi:hypothetical protein